MVEDLESPTRPRRPLHWIWLPVVALLSLVIPASAAWADAQTDRLRAVARERLQKPHRQSPYPCSEFWFGSRDGYVLDLAPWAAAAGVRGASSLRSCHSALALPSSCGSLWIASRSRADAPANHDGSSRIVGPWHSQHGRPSHPSDASPARAAITPLHREHQISGASSRPGSSTSSHRSSRPSSA